MDKRKELIEALKKQHEDEFFKQNGFIMDSRQKKELKKRIEKIVERKMKSISNRIF